MDRSRGLDRHLRRGLGVRRQADRRPEQRGLVLAPRPVPSPPRSSTSSATTVDPNNIPTLVVYNRSSGLTEDDFAAMDEQAAEIAEIDGVTDEGVLSPNVAQEQNLPVQLVSEDGQVAYLYFTFNFGENGWTDIPAAADEVRDIAQVDGVTVHLAGYGGQAADSAEAFEGIDTNLIMITLLVVIVILLLTYRSPTLWLLPIISAVFAYMTSAGVVYLLAKYADLTVNGQSQAILGILVIGAGTDYALLLVARYREELRRHEDRHEAMAFALHRAAPAILASAATVVVSMLCLSFAELNSTAGMGPVLAVGISVTFLVMVTFSRPSWSSAVAGCSGRSGRRSGPTSPRATVSGPAWATGWPPSRARSGSSPPACSPSPAWGSSGSTRRACRRRTPTPRSSTRSRASSCSPTTAWPTTPTPSRSSPTPMPCPGAGSAGGDRRPRRGHPAQDLGTGRSYFEATINANISSPAAFEIVESSATPSTGSTGPMPWSVEGRRSTSTEGRLDPRQQVIVPIVLVVIFLILVGLLTALTAPLILIGTVILSFGAALGISRCLFEFVFGSRLRPGFPLFAFVFLVALGIDYNIVLMTPVRERRRTRDPQGLPGRAGLHRRRDHLGGAGAGGNVLVLGSIPVVFLAEISVAVALGVMLDALIVRSVLVTAINLDLGGKIWWPSKLDRGDDAVEAPPHPSRRTPSRADGTIPSPTALAYPGPWGRGLSGVSVLIRLWGIPDGGCASAAAAHRREFFSEPVADC